MRNGYRFPLSNIMTMCAAFGVIVYILVRTGMLGLIFPFALVFAITAVIAAGVSLVLLATHRSGAHRLAAMRTQPED